MTRKIRRTRSFDLKLEITDPDFLPLPREGQRSWLLNRVVKEAVDELDHLNSISPEFVPGADAHGLFEDRTQRDLADADIMEDWQTPLMKEMARIVTAGGGDVLEIGFGRGIGSEFIQQGAPLSHTIIECNDSVVKRFLVWSEGREADIRLAHGLWQDVLPELGQFDGIFFHTYPLNEAEYISLVARASTFAEHFFPHAARHLRDGGVFTYLTMEADSLGRGHQRALMKHFSSITLSMLGGLEIPHDTRDAHFLNRMIMVAAVK